MRKKEKIVTPIKIWQQKFDFQQKMGCSEQNN